MPRITITVSDKTPQPYRFQLDRQTVTLGRGSENDIAIECGSVSVKHAEMQRVEGGYELRDVGSTNGIKQDGVSKAVIVLRSGVTATLGDVSFDFLLTDEEVELLAREKPVAVTPTISEAVAVVPAPPSVIYIKPKLPRELEKMRDRDSGNGSWLLFLLVLMLIAFFIGMAIHYKKDTGGSLIDAIKAKSEVLMH